MLVRMIRNFIRRRLLVKELGPGFFVNRSTDITKLHECDFCEKNARLLIDGKAICYRHAGYQSDVHLLTAVSLQEAGLFFTLSKHNQDN